MPPRAGGSDGGEVIEYFDLDPGSLDDLVTLDWLLGLVDRFEKFHPALSARLAGMIPASAVVKVLEGPPMARVLDPLAKFWPEERWREIEEPFFAAWRAGRTGGAADCNGLAARLLRERALEYVERMVMGSDGFGSDGISLYGVMQTLIQMTGKIDREVGGRLLELTRGGSRGFIFRLLTLARMSGQPDLRTWIERALKSPLVASGRSSHLAVDVARALGLASDELCQVIHARRFQRVSGVMADLTAYAPGFLPELPLDKIDTLVQANPGMLFDGARRLVEDFDLMVPPVADLVEVAAGFKPDDPGKEVAGLAAMAHLCDRMVRPDRSGLRELRSSDLALILLRASRWEHLTGLVVDELRERPREEAIAALAEMIGVARQAGEVTDGLGTAVCGLGYSEFPSILVPVLVKSDAHLIRCVSCFGDAALDRIEDAWSNLGGAQRTASLMVAMMTGTPAALEFLLRHSDLIGESPQMWAKLGISFPDRRVLDRLLPYYGKAHAEVDDVCNTLSWVLGIRNGRLERWRGRRLARWSKQAQSQSGDRMYSDSGERLVEMRCLRCQKVGTHPVRQFVIAQDFSSTIIPLGDHQCYSCEQWSDFEVTQAGVNALNDLLLEMAERIKTASKVKGVRKQASMSDPILQLYVPDPHGGLVCAVHRRQELLLRLRARPAAADLHIFLGFVHLNLSQNRLAINDYRQALHLDPALPEAAYGMALACQRLEEPEPAYQVISDCLLRKRQWRFYLVSHRATPRKFLRDLQRLADSVKPYGLPRLRIPTSVAAPVERTEVARNAPCPCGSGKKYKRCCGRSGNR